MFQMKQCENRACDFRFPAPISERILLCPLCGGGVRPASESFGPYERTPRNVQRGGLRVEALLDNIRSAYNVGAMFRTADGAGLSHLHLGGVTATPEHRKVAKTALGAEKLVPWTYYRNSLEAARKLASRGYLMWAFEGCPGSRSLFGPQVESHDHQEERPVLLVVGNEVSGVDPAILSICDRVIELPMAGGKESLNVEVAFGVAAYTVCYGLGTK